MLEFALLLGITLAGLCSWAIVRHRGKWALLGLAGMVALTIFCAPVLASAFLFFQSILLFVAISAGLLLRLRPAPAIGACWLVSAGAFALSCYIGYRQVSKIDQWRDQYPFVSLANRLSYERNDPAGTSSLHPRAELSSRIVLASAAEQRLQRNEAIAEDSFRRRELERLHNDRYRAFIATTGFGVGRMRAVHENGLKLPEERMPPRETADRWFALDGLQSEQPLPLEDEIEPLLIPMTGPPTPGRGRLNLLANEAQEDFLNPERFGYSRDGKVSGFVGHRVVHIPKLGSTVEAVESWQIVRLDLVSLLKFPRPEAYLSDRLPDMEQLAAGNIPTRPLNEFESAALPRLRTDEDLVVRYGANTIRMLGSLRAGKTCLECHSVPRGALLGAFSYELRRSDLVPTKASRPAKPKPEA